ncbi:thermonuclease family protein [Mycoplasma sp. Mirounga ES2805-ORL]|uniref:thermonuclease family protein n=1 Tax=Mycoplasma sp. Mirounga ES2805-ORL TaxID=754514 RepID=UPI00197B5335|nr:thermonuclease family protein [Mycoplasma sp. Mirounga ES2805-ORL]QSF13600.1 thermonuclease family protein [Mycoplasma sp. Mirounga ES2805-ORL]
MKFKKILFLGAIVSSVPVLSSSCFYNSQNKNPDGEKKNKKGTSNQIVYESHNIDKVNAFNYEYDDDFKANKGTIVKVNSIRDGDTFGATNILNMKSAYFRFSGIDTPETHKNIGQGNWADTTGKQYKYGKKAEKFTSWLLNGTFTKDIIVVPQKTINGRNDISDPYGRIVAIIYIRTIDNKYINVCEQLVKWGYARMNYISLNPNNKFYTSNTTYYKSLLEAKQYATKNKLGIYSGFYSEIYPF